MEKEDIVIGIFGLTVVGLGGIGILALGGREYLGIILAGLVLGILICIAGAIR